MPDGIGLRWSGAQQAMLRELGCELFVMRGAAEAAPPDNALRPDAAPPQPARADSNSAAARTSSPDGNTTRVALGDDSAPGRVSPAEPATVSRAPRGGGAARARLVMLAPDAGLLRGPQAGLARALLAAVGVHEAEVRGEATAGLPAILFGDAVADAGDALRAPALSALREARAKRALWPALRALRRRLRDGAGR